MEAKRLLLGYACVVMIFLGQLMLELFKLASWRPKSENYPSWLIIYHDSSFIMTPHLSWPIIYCIINNLSEPKEEIIMVSFLYVFVITYFLSLSPFQPRISACARMVNSWLSMTRTSRWTTKAATPFTSSLKPLMRSVHPHRTLKWQNMFQNPFLIAVCIWLLQTSTHLHVQMDVPLLHY